MGDEEKVGTLEGLLDQVTDASEGVDRISLETAFEVVGKRSFGALLVLPGLIAFSPLSGIPGVPSLFGIMVLLITGQLLLGRHQFWLPQFVLRRSVSRRRFEQTMRVLRKVARFIDRFLKRRLVFLTDGPGMYVIAVFCLVLSLSAPLLEVLPFVVSALGVVVAAFGLALLAHDGLLALIAYVAFGVVWTVAGAAFL